MSSQMLFQCSSLPSQCLVGAALLRIEALVLEDQEQETGPGNKPANHLFVPFLVCPQVLRWGHSSRIAFHLGTT